VCALRIRGDCSCSGFPTLAFFWLICSRWGKVERKLPTNSLTGGAFDLGRRCGRSAYSVAPESILMTFIPKRSVTSLEVLRCSVTGKPSFFHAARVRPREPRRSRCPFFVRQPPRAHWLTPRKKNSTRPFPRSPVRPLEFGCGDEPGPSEQLREYPHGPRAPLRNSVDRRPRLPTILLKARLRGQRLLPHRHPPQAMRLIEQTVDAELVHSFLKAK
jgi:hypothetical protein